jgi:site-specific recombinase XerD
MRTVQEWMGHRDFKSTLIYADYAPSARSSSWRSVPVASNAP